MKILNKTKKSIDGIAPMKMADISDEHAAKLKKMYGEEIEIVEAGTETNKSECKYLKGVVETLEAEKKEASEYKDVLEKSNDELEKLNAGLQVKNEELEKANAALKKEVEKANTALKNVPPAPPANTKKSK
jgi:uncharacterized phage infection (PIP) family protein YhgE